MATQLTFSDVFSNIPAKDITIGQYLSFLEANDKLGKTGTSPNQKHVDILREILDPSESNKYRIHFTNKNIEVLTLNSSMKDFNTLSALKSLTEAFKEHAKIPFLKDRKGIKGKTDAETLQNLKDKNLEKKQLFNNQRGDNNSVL